MKTTIKLYHTFYDREIYDWAQKGEEMQIAVYEKLVKICETEEEANNWAKENKGKWKFWTMEKSSEIKDKIRLITQPNTRGGN